ncbi:MAG: hypothetical protein ABI950_09380 [Solirubrobacteraceae bacterium]
MTFWDSWRLVCRSSTLSGNTSELHGLPITTAERALADLASGLNDRDLDRATREALRLRVTTCARIHAMLAEAASRNRPRRLATLASSYARLPIADARSDAEAYAVAVGATSSTSSSSTARTVHRLPTDDAYDRPTRLLAIAPTH